MIMQTFIWITLSGFGAWDNEIVWQRDIQEVIYFIKQFVHLKVDFVIIMCLMFASQVYFVC